MTGNIEELLKQEKKNRPDLQAYDTGYSRISKNGLRLYKTRPQKPEDLEKPKPSRKG